MTRREIALLAAALIGCSAVIYAVQVALFGRLADTWFYLLQDLAFLPLTILIVTVIVSSVLAAREKQAQQHKMNMVIGAFFSDVGQPLLKLMCGLVLNAEKVRGRLAIGPGWGEAEMRKAIAFAKGAALEIDPAPDQLAEVRDLLRRHREFMLRLLENPTLLEHEAFTDLLWAVHHLEEELTARESLEECPPVDRTHLAGDAKRALSGLLVQWLEYMMHLRKDYPFLFSFAARTNPLRPDARAEITE
jgi:hypothetical protein